MIFCESRYPLSQSCCRTRGMIAQAARPAAAAFAPCLEQILLARLLAYRWGCRDGTMTVKILLLAMLLASIMAVYHFHAPDAARQRKAG
jgi:hypothetical protein